MRLLDNLEFSGLYNGSGFIAELKNVNAPVEIIEVDIEAGSRIFNFIHFFSNEIVDFKGITLFITALKIEIDRRRRRVGIRFDHFLRNNGFRR